MTADPEHTGRSRGRGRGYRGRGRGRQKPQSPDAVAATENAAAADSTAEVEPNLPGSRAGRGGRGVSTRTKRRRRGRYLKYPLTNNSRQKDGRSARRRQRGQEETWPSWKRESTGIQDQGVGPTSQPKDRVFGNERVSWQANILVPRGSS
jgi:hypothetical protein